ncbi:amino acid ABC transporter permease [Thorsellia kenyensis]|uniref:Amino acid ABC transporter permease n=1 Tax=Thorsellia kenyensis TaxID=1549888 RepID=A0ABV6C817_9GAMM
MSLDFSFLCFDTITLEAAEKCFRSVEEETYFDWLVSAFGWTISVALCSLAIAFMLGIVIGTLRTLPNRKVIPWFANAYVELFRNIPLLVQIFIWYHVVPAVFPALQEAPSFLLVVLGLGFFSSVRFAEQIKSGILSRPTGQRYAASALGMTTFQSYRFVILPAAFRVVFPPITSETMNIIKNSSVAFAVSIAELTQFALQVQEEVSHSVEVYLVVTALYMFSALSMYLVMRFIERKIEIPGFASPSGLGGH